ncbi:hypothetical protein FA592_01825 [Sulfurospirillum diekertiae]|uniref:Uncharacterized protein n=1 Tax=Sulfurospirillum diekertiae TaxID=1854492 RepID=A0A6G9VQX3_9BACT|nr:hypothetical protein [Sulfurospirillum diekertiae]QIR75023.1 hypothetical protein FA584_01835 [Sulfurospirillum diekertiae]QIR77688.1 hypothetical protein FA592_01825 [Sulfurospirillum diekertiae]
MSIFPRRVIQRILNENRDFLSPEQADNHVKKLNFQSNDSLDTIWEVVILNALSKIGQVSHEKEYDGSSKPDIYFKSKYIEPFVADITSISDDFYEKENPINYFRESLNTFFKSYGLTLKGINIDVDHIMVGDYGDTKLKLALPEKKDIPQFIKKEFFTLRESIKNNPNKEYKIEINKDEIKISISFNPKEKYTVENHASYKTPYSLTKNPLYNSLKKKSKQLRNSKYEGIMGVFICDGECNLINNNLNGANKFSQSDIIQEIFRNNTTLSFVIVLSLEEKRNLFDLKSTKFLKGEFYSNSKAKFKVTQTFCDELKKIENFFPIPETTPVNARSNLQHQKQKGLSYYGGFSMKNSELKISSRMVTELFAGILSFEKFDSDHKKMTKEGNNKIKDFFLRQFREGRVIETISVEKCQDKDDDWITFNYGFRDASISEYK